VAELLAGVVGAQASPVVAAGAAAALSRPGAGPLAALPSLAGVLAGAAALTALVRASQATAAPATRPQAPSSDAVPGAAPSPAPVRTSR
jgi:hypothetical protein